MIRRYLSLRTPHQECTSLINFLQDFAGPKGAYLLIDVDNTLCLRGDDRIHPLILQGLKTLRDKGEVRGICLVSNVVSRSQDRIDRVSRIAQTIGCPYVCAFWPELKPKATPYRAALTKLGALPGEAIMVGDQRLTDVLGANRLGIRTVLVKPLGKDHVITRPRRVWESQVVRTSRLFKVTSPPD